MKENSYYRFFKNLSNKSKFNIVMSLRDGPMSVSDITKKVGEEQSKVSHNLRSLRSCNILKVKQDGKKRIYSLNGKTVIPIIQIVEKHVKNNCPRKCCK
ncbi:MAG: winged helix-turn-helix transcriptional regulator [Candidatus Aenigmarchaeota archaeon]|nr:winged helix-turn-helix transcriptional regulator [Candidatus Aenigmarchaeota archaeon]